MSENVIFCYSGTGNCLDMAKTIARELGDTDIILMRKEPAVTDVRDAKRVGFVFPCYGGGLPGGVEESLRKIQVGLTAYTFGVCQYAGYMGSFDKLRPQKCGLFFILTRPFSPFCTNLPFYREKPPQGLVKRINSI